MRRANSESWNVHRVEAHIEYRKNPFSESCRRVSYLIEDKCLSQQYVFTEKHITFFKALRHYTRDVTNYISPGLITPIINLGEEMVYVRKLGLSTLLYIRFP